MAARNKEMRTEILRSIANTHPNIVSIPIPEDINEVVVGLPISSRNRTDHNVSTTGLSTVEVDLTASLDVREALARLAALVSLNSISKVDVDNLLKEWRDFLSSAKCVGH